MYEQFILEGPVIKTGGWRNFSGVNPRCKYANGSRYFNVDIPEDMADRLKQLGVTVKYSEPWGDETEGKPYIKVSLYMEGDVSPNTHKPYKNCAKVYMVSNGRPVPMTNETVVALDTADIVNAQLSFTVTADQDIPDRRYIKTKVLYAEIVNDDPFASRYDVMPEYEENLPY